VKILLAKWFPDACLRSQTGFTTTTRKAGKNLVPLATKIFFMRQDLRALLDLALKELRLALPPAAAFKPAAGSRTSS
jgi:hypothetical protein